MIIKSGMLIHRPYKYMKFAHRYGVVIKNKNDAISVYDFNIEGKVRRRSLSEFMDGHQYCRVEEVNTDGEIFTLVESGEKDADHIQLASYCLAGRRKFNQIIQFVMYATMAGGYVGTHYDVRMGIGMALFGGCGALYDTNNEGEIYHYKDGVLSHIKNGEESSG